MELTRKISFYKNNKNCLIINLIISTIMLISFVFDILFIDRFKFNLSERILIILFLTFVILSIINLVLSKKIYSSINLSLANCTNVKFDLDAKSMEELYKNSSYDSIYDHVLKNQIEFKKDEITYYKCDINFIKNERESTNAKFYVFKTNELFDEVYYTNHSTFVKHLKDYYMSSLGNTNMYTKEETNKEIKQVEFTYAFYIKFSGNYIFFIDFDKNVFNVMKDLTDVNMFEKYIDAEKGEALENLNKVLTLR